MATQSPVSGGVAQRLREILRHYRCGRHLSAEKCATRSLPGHSGEGGIQHAACPEVGVIKTGAYNSRTSAAAVASGRPRKYRSVRDTGDIRDAAYGDCTPHAVSKPNRPVSRRYPVGIATRKGSARIPRTLSPSLTVGTSRYLNGVAMSSNTMRLMLGATGTTPSIVTASKPTIPSSDSAGSSTSPAPARPPSMAVACRCPAA